MKTFVTLLALFCAGLLHAQRFRPYLAFGPEISYSSSRVHTENELRDWINRNVGRAYDEPIYTLDVYGRMDYGFHRWFGLNTGLGFICRGGGRGYSNKAVRQHFYLSVPLQLQVKPFRNFWLEGGVEGMALLFHRDVNFNVTHYTLEGEEFTGPYHPRANRAFMLAWRAGFRVNLFRGLSLGANWYSGLTPMAVVEAEQEPGYESRLRNYGLSLGVRYMFGQRRP